MAMGIGKLGSPNIMFKTKFRWMLHVIGADGRLVSDRCFVKVAARPQLDIEEVELDFLKQKTWIPGKSNWQSTTITVWGIQEGGGAELTEYVAQVYSQAQNNPLVQFEKCTFVLELFDGCGSLLESWHMKEGFITSVNFGELDFSSSEETTLELEVRYTQVEYKSYCGPNGAALPEGCGVGNYGGSLRDAWWKMPEEWVIRSPIEGVCEGERILDQFLRRTSRR